MSQLRIRQSGGANIVSIPKAILKTLNLTTNSTLELGIEDGRIILTPEIHEPSLEALLEGSPKENLQLLQEDNDWHNDHQIGQEII